ncbi:hypothetical protein [Acinetobacter sp. UBA6720]|uniref:hypothetical protein n=1 Tax=Acinetobacter sp. UBA6720 TaxID=1945953 RepID=UPI0025C5560C|nr:hypothetical protein [Acinetobacter sp. UBA6720]
MECKITVAEFCTKYDIKRHKLNYQFKLKNIEKDEDNKFDEQEMLKLLHIDNPSNVEIQQLKEQLAQVQNQLELLTSCNKTDVEIQHLRDEITQLNERVAAQAILIPKKMDKETYRILSFLAVVNIGLLLHPKTRNLAIDLLPLGTKIL